MMTVAAMRAVRGVRAVPIPFNPNDKFAPAGYGEPGYLQPGETPVYEIRFENTSSATAPPRQIIITDTFDPNLDLDTFELFVIAFAHHTLGIPPGLTHYATRDSLIVTNGTLLPGPDLNSSSANSCNLCLVIEMDHALDFATRTLSPAKYLPAGPRYGAILLVGGTACSYKSRIENGRIRIISIDLCASCRA